ncbi:MAG TPA: DUF3467 domain-containing protein [Candidatus Eisenbacteria bacterium]
MENSQNPMPSPLQVELSPEHAEGIYSNLVFIAHSPSEVILDFARALPGLPKAKVYARVILTPQHAKSLLQALDQNLRNYESQFGAIKLQGETPRGKELGFKS